MESVWLQSCLLYTSQRLLLEDEGVQFKENGCVDMKKYQWKC